MIPERVFEKLRENGLRITPLKKQVVELFLNGACGLSARNVHEILACSFHISTVHRCLYSLEKAGFLRPDRNSDGVLRYRCSRSILPDHGHFKCGKCGRRFPVSCDLPDEFLRMVEKKCDFVVTSSDFFLEGKCARCSGKD